MTDHPPAAEPRPAISLAPDDPPPFGSWGRMYALVLACLAGWIVVFYLFSRAFA